jgi:hypothetical protein
MYHIGGNWETIGDNILMENWLHAWTISGVYTGGYSLTLCGYLWVSIGGESAVSWW